MAAIAPVSMTNGGSRLGVLDVSAIDVAASTGGDTFLNDGNTLFYIDNADASGITVTFVGATDSNGRAVNETVAVGATSRAICGPFPRDLFNVGGSVSVTYSAVTTVTVAAVRMLALQS